MIKDIGNGTEQFPFSIIEEENTIPLRKESFEPKQEDRNFIVRKYFPETWLFDLIDVNEKNSIRCKNNLSSSF